MYKTIKSMREALEEARAYRDTTEGGPGSGPQKGGKKFSSSQIKKAYGILNDPRYKGGNYSGAVKTINKLAPGLADQPDVKNALKRANEELDDDDKETIKPIIKQLQKSVKAHDKQAKQLQKDIQDEVELEEAFTLADYKELESDNQHAEAAAKLVNQYGTSDEKKEIAAINARHMKTGYISGPDFRRRVQISNKYYSRLKW